MGEFPSSNELKRGSRIILDFDLSTVARCQKWIDFPSRTTKKAMKSLAEVLQLAVHCVQYLLTTNGFKFALSLVFGLLLGALGYWAASAFSRLWNRSFHLRGIHHLLCASALLLTVLFSMVYVGVDAMESVASREIQRWKNQAVEDGNLGHELFIRAYDGVRKAGLEDMAGVGAPRIQPDVSIPISKWDTKQQIAIIYTEGSLQDFQKRHPYLASALQIDTRVSENSIKADLLEYFKNDNNAKAYPVSRAVTLAAGHLSSQVQTQIPAIENYTRRVLLALFLILEACVIGLISRAAYRSLTTTV